MTPVAWMLVVIGVGMGLGAGLWAGRAGSRSREAVGTLVPARTRQVLAVLPSGAVIVRRDRRSAYCNNAALALGVARPDGALHPELSRLAERAWTHGDVVEEDIEVKRGVLASSRILHARVSVIDDELALALVSDLTEQQAAEQMRRNFAINVSHELKTPVGAIQLLAESVEAGADDPQIVVRVHQEAPQGGQAPQHAHSGDHRDHPFAVRRCGHGCGAVHLSHVVEEALDATSTAAQARGISVTVDVRADATVLGNEDLLVMALRNLIDNAVQYSDSGKRVIVSTDLDGEVASISVVDQGIGIAPAEIDRIFERFYRVDPARSRETGGTGLGLSIVKHIALRHDGAVDVWSTQGVGSTFTLKLPAASPEEQV